MLSCDDMGSNVATSGVAEQIGVSINPCDAHTREAGNHAHRGDGLGRTSTLGDTNGAPADKE